MNQPAYLQSVNIRCIGGCSQVVKSNGVPVMTHTVLKSNGVPQQRHTVLRHKCSPGETALICRKCRGDFRIMEKLTGEEGNWTVGETVLVYRPAAEYEEPLRKALNDLEKQWRHYSKTGRLFPVAEGEKWKTRHEADPIIAKNKTT
jgi:hypothetical protein